jgi:hypothetical protein
VFISLRENSAGAGVDEVMWSAAFDMRVSQLIIDVPAIFV